MMQTSRPKVNVVIAGAALAMALGLIACSAAQPNTGGFGDPGNTGTGSTSQNGNGDTSDDGGGSAAPTTGGSSGGSSGGGTSSGGSSSGGGSASTSSSSGGTASAEAGAPTASNDGFPIPTAPGITSGPDGATDLAVPDPSVGIQFVTPAMAYAVAPNQEIFPNYCVTVPKDIQVGGFQSLMSEGSSHHFILYKGGQASSSGGACTLGANDWMYASSTPGQVITENMPANVGLAVANGTQLILNMHFINPSTTTMYPQIKLNLLYAQNVKYQAGTMVSFNSQIDVPAATAAGPGTQTVNGTCTAPTGAQFFTMSTHTHKHATAAWVDYIHNGATTEIVHTGTETTYPADQEPGSGVDWEHPGVGLWTAPNFLTVSSGDSFTYHCSYSNTGSTPVTVGETAASNEMCMAIGYYFPAGSAYCQ
jgi:Copper type II ascorbate-dependent monooxygenase, C-terminal domain